MRKFFQQESGQSMVLFALALAVILCCAALGIDTGRVHYAQVDLQTAADMAALAGAGQIPVVASAVNTAKSYAVVNGAEEGRVTVTTPYNGDPTMIEVVCEKTVPHTLGKLIGYDSADLTARAVARKKPSIWAGEALPFMNLDDEYAPGVEIEVWEPTGPGTFESIWKDEREYLSYPAPHFNIRYEDGIAIREGVDAGIKYEIQSIYNYCQGSPDRTVFVFSLRSDLIGSEKYSTEMNGLANKTVIPPEDLVLLEVTFDKFEFSGSHGAPITLTVKKVYDFNAGELPTSVSFLKYDGSSSLVG